MSTVLREYQTESLKKIHHEQWYGMHLWCPIVDRCFDDIEDMEAIRGEACSAASGHRKNADRTASASHKMKRQKIGRKGDLILRSSTNLEFGGGEAGKTYTSEKGTKWLVESGLKLPKMLKDMLMDLAKEVEWSTTVLRTLTTVGFVHGDRRQMVLELDCPDGYVCRLTRGNVYKVADSIATHSVETLPLILMTWRAKAMVRDCVNNVRKRAFGETSLLKLANSRSYESPEVDDDKLIVFGNLETPTKKK